MLKESKNLGEWCLNYVVKGGIKVKQIVPCKLVIYEINEIKHH